MLFCCKREFKKHASTHVRERERERERESCLFVCFAVVLGFEIMARHTLNWKRGSIGSAWCYLVVWYAWMLLCTQFCASECFAVNGNSSGILLSKCSGIDDPEWGKVRTFVLVWFSLAWRRKKKNHLSLSKVAAAQHRSQAIRFGALSSCRCVFMWLTISIRRISDFSGRRRRRRRVQRRV